MRIGSRRERAAVDMAQRWVTARNAAPGNFYLDLKVFPSYTTCAAQPENWHQYGPA